MQGAAELRILLHHIDFHAAAWLWERALIGAMASGFAGVSAVVGTYLEACSQVRERG